MKTKKFNKNKQKKPEPATRKEIRKNKRQKKKLNRAMYNEKKKQLPEKLVKTSANNTEDTDKNSSTKTKLNHEQKLKKKIAREKKQQKQLIKQQEQQRQAQLKEDNEYEDRGIKKLEKLLKLNKRKAKTIPKSLTDDGLDYLLEVCDDETRKVAVETEKQLMGIDGEQDFEEDYAMMMGCDEEIDEKPKNKSKKFSDVSHDTELDENELDGSEENGYEHSDDDTHSNQSAEDSDFAVMDEDNSDEEYDPTECSGKSVEEENIRDGTWEDIYGRKRDKDGTIITQSTEKYLPPAARLKQLEKTTEEQAKFIHLRKILKGLINRLAEHNMHCITTQVIYINYFNLTLLLFQYLLDYFFRLKIFICVTVVMT